MINLESVQTRELSVMDRCPGEHQLSLLSFVSMSLLLLIPCEHESISSLFNVNAVSAFTFLFSFPTFYTPIHFHDFTTCLSCLLLCCLHAACCSERGRRHGLWNEWLWLGLSTCDSLVSAQPLLVPPPHLPSLSLSSFPFPPRSIYTTENYDQDYLMWLILKPEQSDWKSALASRVKVGSTARWLLLRLVQYLFAGDALFETTLEELHLFQ